MAASEENADELLVAYDEAIAKGLVPGELVFTDSLSVSALKRLRANQGCVRALEAMWPRHASDDDSLQHHTQALDLVDQLLVPTDEDSLAARTIGTLQEFKDALVGSELFCDEDLEASLEAITCDLAPNSVEQLAYELVQRRFLNRDQAAALCRGELSRLLLDDYLVLSELGRGGMGIVYKALDRNRDRFVALKTLYRCDGDAILRLKREFRTLADLAHRNLVVLDELSSVDGRWFFTMELVEGVRFTEYYQQQERDTSKLHESLRQLVTGLSALHSAGLLHLDVKPSNVLVTASGRVVLLDFGMTSHQGSGSRRVGGTLPYMSPEQMRGDSLSEATDWYSLGVMLWETLVGERPFAGCLEAMRAAKHQGPPPLLWDCLPEDQRELGELCQELLVPAPQQRADHNSILALVDREAIQLSTVTAPAEHEPERELFVGRDTELKSLREAYRHIEAGHAKCVFVDGESGIGKSTLVRRFLAALPDAIVLEGRCYERESIPYKSLDSIIDALIGCLEDLSDEARERVVPDNVASLVKMFPALRRLPVMRSKTGNAPPDEREVRRRAVQCLRQLLCNLRALAPVVLVVDDLQWGDVDSAVLLGELFRGNDAPSLMLIGCFRSEHADASESLSLLTEGVDLDACIRLSLAPLSDAEAVELIRALAGGDRVFSKQLEDAIEEAQGSPYFIHEMVGHYCSSNDRGAKTFKLAAVLDARLESLSELTRRLLEVIAVAGHPLEVADLQQVVGATDTDLELAVLRSAKLVRTSGTEEGEIESFHDRIRESVAARLSRESTRRYHDRLARVFEALAQQDPELIGTHFRAAGNIEKARHYITVAADQASEQLAFGHAATLYRQVLDLGGLAVDEQRSVLERMAKALSNAGRNVEAADSFLRASGLAIDAHQLELKRLAADHYFCAGHVEAGKKLLGELLTEFGLRLPPSPRHTMFRIMRNLILLRLRGTDYRERSEDEICPRELVKLDTIWTTATAYSIIAPDHGVPFGTAFIREALRVGEPSRVARALTLLAHIREQLGADPRDNADLYQASEEISNRNGDLYATSWKKCFEGSTALFAGDFSSAIQLLDSAEDFLRENCFGINWDLLVLNVGSFAGLFYYGDLIELRKRVESVIVEAHESDDILRASLARTWFCSSVWLASDDVEAARRFAREANSPFPNNVRFFQHTTELIGSTQIDLYAGEAETAWNRIADRCETEQGRFNQFVRDTLHQLRARAALQLACNREGSERRRLLHKTGKDARRLCRSSRRWCRPLGALIQAGIASTKHQPDKAITLLNRAIDELDRADMHLYAAAARRRLGELIGGDAGAEIFARGTQFMARQEVVRPDRMTNMLAPGFRS